LLVIWLVHGVPVTVWLLLLLGGVDKVQQLTGGVHNKLVSFLAEALHS
jgi:hypothetical protein